MDVTGHDADLYVCAGGDHAGAVGADERYGLVANVALDSDGVHNWDALGDAGDGRDARVNRFDDGIRCEGRRHEYERAVRLSLIYGLPYGVEYGDIVVEDLSTAPRRYAGDQVGAVLAAAQGVEAALSAGDALHHQSRIFVNKNSHRLSLSVVVPDV